MLCSRAVLLFMSANDISVYESISAKDIGRLLNEAGVNTVILNACNSANASSTVNANLCVSLLQSGVRAALGMSHQLHIDAAHAFMSRFYKSFLVDHFSLSESAYIARKALRVNRQRKARFQQVVEVEDWTVPVFYELQKEMRTDDKVPKTDLFNSDDLKPLGGITSRTNVMSKTEDLILLGRDIDMHEFENQLLSSNGILLVDGRLGVGKTCFVIDLAAWWIKTGFLTRLVYIDYFKEEIFTMEPEKQEQIITESRFEDIEDLADFVSTALEDRSTVICDHTEHLSRAQMAALIEAARKKSLSKKTGDICSFLILVSKSFKTEWEGECNSRSRTHADN